MVPHRDEVGLAERATHVQRTLQVFDRVRTLPGHELYLGRVSPGRRRRYDQAHAVEDACLAKWEKPSPQTLEEALADLDGKVDLALDGGKAEFGQGSTVVDISGEELKVLREGVIPAGEIEGMAQRKTILFVCTGNSCRSVMAHYLLQHLVREKPDIEVCSAGTSVFLQSKASADTLAVLAERGIDASAHLSRPINSILLRKADLIFVMTRAHRQQVLERMPEVEKRVYLLKEFAAEPGSLLADLDIPDPIGRDRSEYKFCMGVIEQAVNKVVGLL